jgi:hypothetical protein
MTVPGSASDTYTNSALVERHQRGAGWRGHLKLAAYLAGQRIVDLAVARDDGSLALRASPSCMVAALIDLPAPMSAQVALQLAPLMQRSSDAALHARVDRPRRWARERT